MTLDELRLLEAAGPAPVVVDVRWYLDGRDGRTAYEAGHVPGARFIDLDRVLSSPPTAVAGRHPLPPAETFAAGLAEAGIGDDDPVVAYDDLGGMVAGRLVWMLRIIGAPAALLDGGVQTYDDELVVGPGPATPLPARRRVVPWPAGAVASADEVARHVAGGGVVADSRAGERYRGETEPVDARAGHVPGAINLPFADNLVDGRFLPRGELAERFRSAGVDGDTIFYCGSGVSACHNVLAAEAAGLGRPRLYVGSWSQWSADDGRPVAVGDRP